MNIKKVLFKKFYYNSYEKLIDNATELYYNAIKSKNKTFMLNAYAEILNLDTFLFIKSYYNDTPMKLLDGLYDHMFNK